MVLIRRSGGEGHQPESSKYDNERELQELVKRTATLLPGGNALPVVAEFSIPGIGSADLVGVSASGDIIIVECKLNSNPEIRREVVGKILAYAGGLWRMGYDEFASTFAARSGQPLLAVLQAATGTDIEEGELRQAVRGRLAAGEFRLIIAVDAITPKLRLIIEYLNEHTLPTVKVFALDLSFARDGELEPPLIPTVYGEEAADRKTRAASGGSAWNATTFAEEVQARTDGPVRAFIDALLEHGGHKGHHPYYGYGATPGMSYYYDLGGRPVSVWALYLKQPVPKLAISFGAINKWAPDRARSLLKRLKTHAGLAAALADMDDRTLHRYPEPADRPRADPAGCTGRVPCRRRPAPDASTGGGCDSQGGIGASCYDASELDPLPSSAVAASIGCANPVAVAELRTGEVVLDLARSNQRRAGVDNIEFLNGRMESIPLPEASVDVVLSNCVIARSVDKAAVFSEAHRVLRRAGASTVADVVTQRSVASPQQADAATWVDCVSGALTEAEYRTALATAGFVDVSISHSDAVEHDLKSVIVRASKT